MRFLILSLAARYQVILFILSTMFIAFLSACMIHFIFASIDMTPKYALITSIYTMLGTLYAVLIAFCISGVWQNFSASELAVTNEAAALNDLVHIVCALTKESGEKIRKYAIEYLENVIAFEWDMIAKNPAHLIMTPENKTFQTSLEIVHEIQSMHPRDARENVIFSRSLDLLTKWLDTRRTRIVLSKGNNAKTLWPLLITGALILFSFHGFYIFDNHRLWMTLLFFCSGIIGLSFYLIFTLDNPLTGSPAVNVNSFRWTLQLLKEQKI